MMDSRPFLTVALMLALGAAGCGWADEVRTWTDSKGRKLEAAIVRATKTSVVISRAEDNKQFTIPLDKLSLKDQVYVDAWLEGKAGGSPVKRPAPGDEKPSLAKSSRNLEGPWPKTVPVERDIEITVATEDVANRKFVYESPHFVLESSARLSDTQVEALLTLFETTRNYTYQIPLEILGSADERIHGAKNKVIVAHTREEYIELGGGAVEWGAFFHKEGKFFTMLVLEGIAGDHLSRSGIYENSTVRKAILHEIAHQMDAPFRDLVEGEPWWLEGFAEYISETPFDRKGFDDRKIVDMIVEVATDVHPGVGGHKLGKEVKCGPMKEFMLRGYEVPRLGYLYGMGMYLVYYFMHVDRGGDRVALNAYLGARKEGKSGEDLLNTLLLDRSWEDIETAVSAFWAKHGITIKFEY